MEGHEGGKVRDNGVTTDLDELIETTSTDDVEFRTTAADTEDRLQLLQEFANVRRKRKLSQTDIANRMATVQSAISEMEKGLVEPRLSTLQRYARILGYRLRLALIEEPVAIPYKDRAMRYTPIAVKLRRRPRTPASRSESVEVVTLGNVSYVQFERTDSSHLSGSLARRYKTVSA